MIAVHAALVDALAEELVLSSKLLADLAFDLGEDEGVLRRHMTSLQAIDHVTQLQLAIATALRQIDRGADLIPEITLEGVQARLAGALAS